MRQNITISEILIESGIRPSAFAFFLTQFAESNPAYKTEVERLLTEQLKAQSDLILYHLLNPPRVPESSATDTHSSLPSGQYF